MMTLMRFATADSIGDIYMPVLRRQPLLAPYFLLVVMIVTVLITNLVTAAVIESAIRTSKQNNSDVRESIRLQTERFLPELRQAFKELDEAKQGSVNIDTFVS